MRSMATVAVLLTGCMVGTGCFGRGDGPDRFTPKASLKTVGLGYYWRYRLELKPKETLLWIHQLDEHLYCLTSENRLIAVSATTGHRRWTYDVGHAPVPVFRPTHASQVALTEKVSGVKQILSGRAVQGVVPTDVVVLNTRGEVMVLARKSGKEIRRARLPFAANNAGTTDGKRFYGGTGSGLVKAFDLQIAIETSTFYTANVVSAPLVFDDRHLYIGSEDGKFYAVAGSPRIRSPAWFRRLGGPVTAPFHVDKRACFVPCEDNRLYAFRTFNGGNFWEMPFICQGPCRTGVQVGDSTVFQYAEGDKFYAINLLSGAERWSTPDARDVLTLVGGKVFLRTAKNRLVIRDEVLGTVAGTVEMKGFDLFVRNVKSPAIWVAARDGSLACIRPR